MLLSGAGGGGRGHPEGWGDKYVGDGGLLGLVVEDMILEMAKFKNVDFEEVVPFFTKDINIM